MIRRWAWPVMGSMASLAIPGTVDQRLAERAARQVRTRLAEAEARFSPFRPDSELCRSWQDGGRPAPSAPMREVVVAVEQLCAQTRGAFNPIDRDGRFDPTGYVKGWAVQRAVEQVRGLGVDDICLGIGGDLQCMGVADRLGVDQPWRVAIVDPADARRIVAIVATHGPLAVATSGNAQRGEHIRGPVAWPLGPDRQPIVAPVRRPPRLASVTVAGPELGRADAFATAIWAGALQADLDQAWSWLGGTGYAALAVDQRGRVRWTSGMTDLLVRPAA